MSSKKRLQEVENMMTSPLIDTTQEEKLIFGDTKMMKAETNFNKRIFGETSYKSQDKPNNNKFIHPNNVNTNKENSTNTSSVTEAPTINLTLDSMYEFFRRVQEYNQELNNIKNDSIKEQDNDTQLKNLENIVEQLKESYTKDIELLKLQNIKEIESLKSVFKLSEEENSLLKLKIKSYDKYIDDSTKYNIMVNSNTYNLYTRLTKYKSLVPGIYDKFNSMLDDFDNLEIDNTELTEFSKLSKDINDCINKNESKFNKTSKVDDKCEWVNSEEEMVANLPLFKPGRYIEYVVPVKTNIGSIMANGVFLRNDESKLSEHIMLPQMKYSSHIIGFRVVLKDSVIQNNIKKLKFVLYSGSADIQSFTYNINSIDNYKSLVSPRFNLPDRLVNENLSVVTKGKQFAFTDITSILVDPRYVKDLYCYYRINSSVMSQRFREYNFQDKYKISSKKVYDIFIRSYSELQDAAMNNRLDIFKWIMYGDEYEDVCNKYSNIVLSDINFNDETYHEQCEQFYKKKSEIKSLLYLNYGNDIIDRDPSQRFIFVLKQALTYKAADVALFLLIEMIDHLDIKVAADEVLKAAAAGCDVKCIQIALKFRSYMMGEQEAEELHLNMKRSTIKHQELYQNEELNIKQKVKSS